MISVEKIEDEYYVQIKHEMTKSHYISFIAALSSDKVQMIKLYPEGAADARIKINGVRQLLFYCNRDGLFSFNIINREKSY
jgi:desulfoferrodoxin (superoxide reductase-like protein)